MALAIGPEGTAGNRHNVGLVEEEASGLDDRRGTGGRLTKLMMSAPWRRSSRTPSATLSVPEDGIDFRRWAIRSTARVLPGRRLNCQS